MIKKFLKDIYLSRYLLYKLVINDIKQQYLGSFLGILWAFVQPIVNILVMWFVFQVGFKSAGVEGVPFILWLSAGMIPWFFINDAISRGTNVIIDYSYLVKKIVFRVSLLPLIKIFSSLFIHLFFILFLILMFLIYGYKPSIYWLQVPFYTLCAMFLSIGIVYITASINVFFKDMSQIVNMVLQILFWVTPIFWTTKLIPKSYLWIIKLNPFYYIIEGYRNAFIHHIWFWQQYKLTLYFLFVSTLVFFIGINIFRRLKPHFADVL